MKPDNTTCADSDADSATASQAESDIASHKKEFDRVIRKYCLADEQKAEAIADFLTQSKSKENRVDVREFASLFDMREHEATLFLSFIERGIRFKEEHIDNAH